MKNPPSGQISTPFVRLGKVLQRKFSLRIIRLCHIFCCLRGSARYEKQDGRIALYLDGSSGTFGETLSFPIYRTSLTIAVWIKMKSSGAQYVVYGDWSYPWSFRLFIDPSSHFCAQARNTAGKDIFRFCTR